MNAIMHDKIRIAEAVNAKIISLDDAPLGYQNFDQGESVKCAAPAHRARTRLRFPHFCLSVCRLFAQVRDGPSRRNGQGSGARVTRLYQTYLRRTGSRRRRRGSPLQGARRGEVRVPRCLSGSGRRGLPRHSGDVRRDQERAAPTRPPRRHMNGIAKNLSDLALARHFREISSAFTEGKTPEAPPGGGAGWLVPHFAHSGPETVGWLVWPFAQCA